MYFFNLFFVAGEGGKFRYHMGLWIGKGSVWISFPGYWYMVVFMGIIYLI